MALTATFTANFSSFYDAVDKADAKLKDFGDGADKVGTRLNILSNQFTGQRIIQEATVMAKAIEEVGGTAGLTEAQFRKLGATTNEAVAIMKRLGMDVPKNIQDIADKTKQADKATHDWMGTVTKMAGAIGIAFSVGAVKDFIGSIFDAASAVKNLSEQWGVSTRAVQQWSAEAKASGIAAETIGKSIQFLSGALSESTKEYDALLANVGLSGDALRKLPMEDSYRQVLAALSKVEDQTLRLDLAIGLLGPSAKTMTGALGAGFLDAADKQKFMADETIARLAGAEAAWGSFKDSVVIYSGEMLGAVVDQVQTMTRSWGTFFAYMAQMAGGNAAGAQAILDQAKAVEVAAAATKAAKPPVDNLNAATDAATAAYRRSREVLDALAAQQGRNKKATEELTAAELAGQKAREAYTRTTGDLATKFAGGGLVDKARDYLTALERTIDIELMTADVKADINKTMADAIEVYEAAGQAAPRAMLEIWGATNKVQLKTVELNESLDTMALTINKMPTLPLNIGEGFQLPAPPQPGTMDGFGKGVATAIGGSVMKAVQGGGSVLQSVGSAVGDFILDPGKSGLGGAIEGAAKKLPGMIGGAVASMIPMVGPLIGPAVGWLSNKISSFFGKKEHEKVRDAFVKAAGGIGPLTEAAKAAGISLDELMKARKTDQVEAAIGKLQSAMEFQQDAYGAAMEAAQRYGFTLEELGPAMARQQLDQQAQQLYKDWQVLNAAGIDTVAITERMSESVSQYVNDAVKMGTEVPNAMKPMLEAMVKSGTLLDENGNAIENLEDSGISFAMTMSDGFKAMIEETKKLTDAIGRSLGLAITDIPPPKVQGRVQWLIDKIEAPKQAATGEPLQSFSKGTEGFRNFGSGTPVMLHGWEAVVPREDSASLATVAAPLASSSAPAGATIVINAQGAFFDTPESLQRLAGKVSDALTAKYSLMGKLRAAV